jgi:hypothetical protein
MRRAVARAESNASTSTVLSPPSTRFASIRPSRLRGRMKQGPMSASGSANPFFPSSLTCVFLVITLSLTAVYAYFFIGVTTGAYHLNRLRTRSLGNVTNRKIYSRGKHFPLSYPVVSRGPLTQLSEAALDMCTKTLWHTVETTTIVLPGGETFVHTGDIDDLWLRVSKFSTKEYTSSTVAMRMGPDFLF